MMEGYHGKFLKVDLGSGTISEFNLDSDDLVRYIGGSTLGAKLIYESLDAGRDPLDPASPLVFSAGPLTGSVFPMVSRSAVCGISPATGIWGEATTGGTFPVRLKASGFDGIFITGRASRPVYLYVKDGSADLYEAKTLWGKDSYATQELIRKQRHDAHAAISCIGPAGEQTVKYACIMNDGGRAAGRCGLGALMGSKKLKAVVCSGNRKAAVADEERIKGIVKSLRATVGNHLMTAPYREYGTNLWMDFGMRLGDVPAKYFTKSVFPSKRISGGAFREKYQMRNYACHGCPIGCGRLIPEAGDGIGQVDGPEYETTAAFGPLLMNFDIDTIVRANHLCNLHGLDTISAGVSIAFAMYLFEKGKLTKEKAGMEIRWGDGKAILKLINLIIRKKGIGKLLAEGTREMARALRVSQDEAAHVKGLEVPMHDARAFVGMALTYATGPRGACHLKGDYFTIDTPADGVPELGIFAGDKNLSPGKAVSVARFQCYTELYNSLTLCKFAPYTASQICEMLSTVTGWTLTPQDLLAFGERSLNLKRAINNRLGITRGDDTLPRIVTKALSEGATAGQEPDMALMLKDYYDYMKWDWDTGKPTKEKLVALGLETQAHDLWHA